MIEQEQQKQALAKLRDMVEEAIGRKMKTPKDFEFLSEQVFEKLHETVSATTLKRIWGYLSEASIPRIAFVKNLVDTNLSLQASIACRSSSQIRPNLYGNV